MNFPESVPKKENTESNVGLLPLGTLPLHSPEFEARFH